MSIFKYTILFLFLLFGRFLIGQDRVELMDYSKWKFMESEGKYGKASLVADSILAFTTTEQPSFIYKLSSMVRIKKQNISKGQIVLVQYDARTISSDFETGEAKILWLLKQGKTYKQNLSRTLSISSHWQTFYVPFKVDKNISQEELKLSIQYGFRPQIFELKNLKVGLYPVGTDVSQLPKTRITYKGMDPQARWRKIALQRIENIRKANFTIQFKKDGKPLADQLVNIKLKKHDFSWGAALNAEDVVDQTDRYIRFKSAFTLAVFENDLKIKSWSKNHIRERTLKALEILGEDGIDVKGHVLVWPGFNYLTREVRRNKDNPEKVNKIIENHVQSIVKATKGKISRWDVINEAYTNQDLQRITGSEKILFDAFQTLEKLDNGPLKYLNEYGIISKGGIDLRKQQWYKQFAMRVDSATGGLLDGIGIQSHMGSDLTPPERVLEILDFYAGLGKKISISEFTMEIDDAEIRAKYTRDFLIAAFSHPSVSEFLFWGYDNAKNNKVDIFKDDGLGSMGEVYFKLVHDLWTTVLNAKSDPNGLLSGHGFYGIYEYSYVENNRLVTGTFQVRPGHTDSPIVISVD